MEEDTVVLNHRGKGWIVALAVALVLVPAAYAAGLKVELAPVSDQAVLGPNDGVPLRFIVTNETDDAVAVLYAQMPFRGLETNLFRVELNGERVDYIGRMVARLAPGPEDWMEIGPRESISTMVDLARSYDMSEPGTYTVEFDFPLQVRDLDTRGNGNAAQGLTRVQSDVLLISTAGAQVGQFEGQGGPPVSEGCTPEQYQLLELRQGDAELWAGDSDAYMDGIAVGDRPYNVHYDTWFGAYDSTRWATVNTNFEVIEAALGHDINYTCTSCGRTTVAYVYKTLPYEVWICPTFFDTRLIDEAYQVGVILHEASHWNPPDGAGTDDYAYGESNCMTLADTNPDSAIDNADSYHMFAKYLP